MIYPSACQYNHEYTLSIQKDSIKQKWIHTIKYEFCNNLHCFNVMINKNCIRQSKIWYKMELFLLNEVSSMLHDIIWYVLPIFSMHSVELGNNAANLWGQREIFPFGHFISKSRQSWFSKQNSHQIRIIKVWSRNLI